MFLPALLLLLVTGPAFAPKDEHGRVTRNGGLAFLAISCIYFGLYLWVVEAFGSSAGKRLMAIRVVRAGDWRRPGVVIGFVRTVAKAVTLVTLGVGFVVMLRDPERRALDDRLAGTRVIEL